MENFFLATFALRFAKWLTRSAFKILVIAVVFGFFVWLFFIKLGYGEALMEYVGSFLEFLGFIRDAGSKLR